MSLQQSQQRPTKSKACEECRRHKLRCLPKVFSPAQAGPCERCARIGRECVRPPIRPRSDHGNPGKRVLDNRITLLENQIQNLLDTLQPLLSTASSLPSSKIPESAAGSEQTDHSLLNLARSPRQDDICTETDLQAYTPNAGSASIDAVDRGILSLERARDLITAFRGRVDRFPFVVVPSDFSLDDLRHECPMLLQAIFIVTLSSDTPLQDQLEREYISSISQMVLLEGRKSLDIVQSILVYSAWYHLVHKPGHQRMYQLTSLAASLLVDLGYHEPPKLGIHQAVSFESITVDAPTSQPVPSTAMWPPSTRRAIVGCYFLTSMFSVLLRKPPLMMDSEYITTCATTLAEENQTETDITIPSKLGFARHATLISTAFRQKHLQSSHLWNAATLDAYLSTFSAGLARWIESSSRVPWSNLTHTVQVTAYMMNAFTREAVLHAMFRDNIPSTAHTEMLIECLVYTKAYLDAVLDVETADLGRWTSLEWTWLNYMLLLLVQISTCLGTEFLNASMTRNIIKSEEYLDALVAKVHDLKDKSGNSGGRWYQHLIERWKALSLHYVANCANPQTINSGKSGECEMYPNVAATIYGGERNVLNTPAECASKPRPINSCARREWFCGCQSCLHTGHPLGSGMPSSNNIMNMQQSSILMTGFPGNSAPMSDGPFSTLGNSDPFEMDRVFGISENLSSG